MHSKKLLLLFTVSVPFLLLFLYSPVLFARQVSAVTVDKDATLYETESGNLSNGVGEYLFFGRTGAGGGNALRRSLLHFGDVGFEIPNDAVIDSLELSITVNKVQNSNPKTVTIHRVTKSWGVGTSNATGNEGQGGTTTDNDATWIHRFSPDSAWTSPGGDFEEEALATMVINGNGTYTFKGNSNFVALLQAWKDSTIANYGIIMLGDESDTPNTAARFVSSNSANTSSAPLLNVYYTEPNTTATEPTELPLGITLGTNYPNPFNPETTIPYKLSETSAVKLAVYDLLGREVSILVNEVKTSGSYSIRWNAENVPTGIYFYRLSTPLYTQTKRLMLIK